MIRRTLLVASWLAAGAALVAALYWLFLNTPESNVLMLSVSALLVLLMIALAATVANVAVLIALGGPLGSSVAVGARRAGWCLVVAVPLAALIWVVLLGDAWVARHAGEISAWFIARSGWADITPLFTAQRYVSVWLRWVLLPVAALAALASFLRRDTDGRRGWLRATWCWRTLLIATLAFVVLVVLPWRAAFWRPEGLPHTWIEPTIAAAKLAVVAALMAIGFAIMVVAAARHAFQSSHHVET